MRPILAHFILLLLTAAVLHAGEIKRAPLLSPDEALKAFQLSPDLRIELVASEPLVIDPVDMAFDEDGRLYVAEMIDYPFAAAPGRGRIRLLEDTDGDGVMDRSEVFSDALAWPTSVAVCNGGVLVATAPSIYFLRDTDGDRKADVKQEIFTGFGKQNVQALLNNIKWSIENRFVCATGGNGGKIRSLLKPDQPELSIGGRDLAFTSGGDCEALSGGGQFGNTFDDFGRRFVCSNSVQARHVVLEERYLKRNPHLPVASALHSIAADGDAGPVFRSSPVEQWRIQRTQMRLTGESPGLIEFGGKVAGYFTSATGITVYRGTAMGSDYYGNLFIGDVASNLVHRKSLKPAGATFRAERINHGSEFLASTDNAFRPVNFANGPDGALYICDMYRECIEHPVSIPENIKQHLDLNSKSRGRIWRVTGKNAPRGKLPRLSSAKTAELIDALQRPDAWWRETAQRLLFERQDKAAIKPLEALIQKKETPPSACAAALWALEGMGALRVEIIAAALRADSPDVCAHALRLGEPRLKTAAQLKAQILSMNESNPRSQFQLALTLGEINSPGVPAALARLATSTAGDPWLRTAVLNSAANCSAELLAAAPSADPALLQTLAFMIGARNDDQEISRVINGNNSWLVLAGVADGMRRKGTRLIEKRPELQLEFAKAAAAAKDKAIAENKRLDALHLLAHGDLKTAQLTLPALISAQESAPVQSAALRALSSFDDPSIGENLLAAWATLSPALRNEALKGWFNRPVRLAILMAAIEQKKLAADDLPSDIRKQLRAQFKERAAALIEEQALDRKAVVARYRPALALKGDAKNGETVFQKNCATCHRVANAGHELGPDIETASHRTPEELLEHILDPSREVQAQYVLYTIATTDGRVLEGILTSQSAASVTLKRASSESHVILRPEIKTMLSSTRSPMPEELEKTVNAQQMADLIEYIRSRVKK